jgi:hypothetical protein
MAFSSDEKRKEPVIFHLSVALVGNIPLTPGNLDLVKYLLSYSLKTIVVWTSLGPLLWWVPGPTTRWAPGTTRLVLHDT